MKLADLGEARAFPPPTCTPTTVISLSGDLEEGEVVPGSGDNPSHDMEGKQKSVAMNNYTTSQPEEEETIRAFPR